MRKIRNKTCILKKENVPPNGRVLTWDEFTTAASFPTFLTLEEVGFDVLTGNENEIQVETTNQKMLEPFQLVEEQAPAGSTNGQVEFPEYEDIFPPQITPSTIQQATRCIQQQ